MTVNVYLGLGSNLGDREENLSKAIELVDEFCTVKRLSQVYKTEPVEYKDQDWFLNCVIEVETDIEPEKLLSQLKSIEKKLGRANTIKNGPRTIDIDILFYGDMVIEKENLIIPHPRLHERLFALRPLADLNPGFSHPVLGKTIKELIFELKSEEKVEAYK